MGCGTIPQGLDDSGKEKPPGANEKVRGDRTTALRWNPGIHRHGLTNAIAEGLNRIIKIVKNRASGFRTLDPFADMIYLTVGDVDIPAHIPSKFRTV